MQDSVERGRKEYFRARADNVKEKVSIYQVLEHYGIPMRTEDREIQYPCPLHGDGRDAGFSARAYPGEGSDHSSTYCFGCQKSRDVIEWVRDQEQVSFMQAIKHLEQVFSLEGVPNIYDYHDPKALVKSEGGKTTSKIEREMASILESSKDQATSYEYLQRKIERLGNEGNVKPMTIVKLYFVYDSITFDRKQGEISEKKAISAYQKLQAKIEELGRAS